MWNVLGMLRMSGGERVDRPGRYVSKVGWGTRWCFWFCITFPVSCAFRCNEEGFDLVPDPLDQPAATVSLK